MHPRRTPSLLRSWPVVPGFLLWGLAVTASCRSPEDDTGKDSGKTETGTEPDTGPFDLDEDGWTPSGGDCDDTDPSVNPGVQEVCNNTLDDNCDDTPLPCRIEGTVHLSLAHAVLLGEAAADQAGSAVALCDANDDGYADAIVGAPGESVNAPGAGAAYLALGPLEGAVDLSGARAKLLGEQEGDNAGSTLAAGDVSGDGIEDILVGAPYQDAGGTNAGVACLVLGPVQGMYNLALPDASIAGEHEGDRLGTALASADANNDGIHDLLIGANGEDTSGTDAGAVYLFHGPVEGAVSASQSDAKIVAEAQADGLGYSLAFGEFDGDGILDVLVGVPYQGAGGSSAGAAYVVLGPVAGTLDLGSAETKLVGEVMGDFAGNPVATRDLDGDGLGDLLVGAIGDDAGGTSAGAVYVVLRPLAGSWSLSDADAKIVGEEAGDLAGWALATGDDHGDGLASMIVGAPSSDTGGSGAGAVYLVRGPWKGLLDLSEADAKIVGENAGDGTGYSLAMGDVSGEGYADLLVGALGVDAGGSSAGAAYLVLGLGY
ncbi:MAG: FG-GAP repeat protein [Deltaproteobacteria bacterium]|nr:FG-GAP repeat protein [Deltaproteobacteria bacterium]